MTKRKPPGTARANKFPKLGAALSISSHNKALDFLHNARAQGWPYSERVRVHAYGGTYILGAKSTGKCMKVWATIRHDSVPDYPARLSLDIKRKADSWPNDDRLVRALELCILDARAEIRRRSFAVAVERLAHAAQTKRAGFWDALQIQEGLGWDSAYNTMTVEQAELWLNWLARWSAGEVPLPPSRQLGPAKSPFRVRAGRYLLIEGQRAFYLYRMINATGSSVYEKDDARNLGDLAQYNHNGAFDYHALSADLAHNAEEWAEMYFREGVA